MATKTRKTKTRKKAGTRKPRIAKKPVTRKPRVAKKPVTRKPVTRKPVAKEPVAKEPVGERTAPAPGTQIPIQSPVPVAWLDDAEGRERAFDTLASWVASALQAAPNDGAAREILRVAIRAFHDIRAAANQPRNGLAGHFFIVDGVGLEGSNRPVPWQVLAETVSQERLDRYSAIFDELERGPADAPPAQVTP